MADVEVTVDVSSVKYTTWLRTSYIASSILDKEGEPMIKQLEFGTDQEDALIDFLTEATREVLKVFLSRQGDVSGTPFEYDGSEAIYRFNEATPVLSHADSIKSSLFEDTKNAVYVYCTFLWFQFKGNDTQATYMLSRYEKLISNIDRHLYKLHD
jgi:hypothetical protein